jgi:hypothetical protein
MTAARARPWARVEAFVPDLSLTGEEIDAGTPHQPTLEASLRGSARLWISRRELARHVFAGWPRVTRRRREPGQTGRGATE